MFVKADSLDVVPRGRLMTEKALADLRVRLARDAHRNHFEVHHVMAWRGLMALRAGLRDGRRVAEFRDRPLRRAVALRAVIPEQSHVTILRLVAGGAVEQRFFPLQNWRGGSFCVAGLRERILELLDARGLIWILPRRFLKLLQTDAPQRDVIHFG